MRATHYPMSPQTLTVNHHEIALSNVRSITIQAALLTHPTYLVFWNVKPTATTCTIVTSEGFLSHGGTATINVPFGDTQYLNVLVTDSAGVAQTPSTLDYLLMWGETE
jgi:hypothetical protein